jgi:chromosome segregation ATPase
VAGAYHESEIAYQRVRTLPNTLVRSYPLTESPQDPVSEVTALHAEVDQLREELSRTKVRLKGIEDEKDEVKKQQKAAALVDAQDEVARLKRRVENLDDLLEQAIKDQRRLRDQLRQSEERIEELEGQVRDLRRRRTQEENSAPQNNATVRSPSPQKVPQEKPGNLRASRKSPALDQCTFLVSVEQRKKKMITRSKGGTVPLAMR